MTILGTQHKLHREHITDDAGDYETKTYTVTVRLYPSEDDDDVKVARRKFEDELINKVVLAGDGRLRVDTVTD